MKPNNNLTDCIPIEPCRKALEAPQALGHCSARQDAALKRREMSGKFYRGKFYRGKFYPGKSATPHANTPFLPRRVGVTRGACPGLSGQFDRIMVLCGALNSEIFE